MLEPVDFRAQLAQFCAQATAVFAGSLLAAFSDYGIDTPLRRQHFLAQCAHESGGFRHLEENLNYSAESLRAVWPSRFDEALAAECARQPERIANVVYASRMGNGDTASGEGWLFRGRGLIQITGKSNYAQFSADCYGDGRIVASPQLVAQPENAALSAAWFWKSRGCNAAADVDDLTRVTKLVNGGLNGLEDRAYWLKRAKESIT